MSKYQRLALGVACLLASSACGPPARITVLQATYGGNCEMDAGNATNSLVGACDGRTSCDYTIDVQALGDPRFGCAKAFEAIWRCPGEQDVRRFIVPGESGRGSVAELTCARSRPVIKVLEATYGANCNAQPGNATAAVAGACDGQAACEYKVDVNVLGDPHSGCAKSFEAVWRCAGEGILRRVTVPEESGLGSMAPLACVAPGDTLTP